MRAKRSYAAVWMMCSFAATIANVIAGDAFLAAVTSFSFGYWLDQTVPPR